MSEDSSRETPPRVVRIAGVSVGAQGLAGLIFTVALAVRAATGADDAGDVLGEAVYFALIGGGLAAVGHGLFWGRRWARTPALVVQLLLLPVVYSLLGPSDQPEWGVLLGVVAAGTLCCVLAPSARAWAVEDSPGPPTRQSGSRRDRSGARRSGDS